MLNVHVYRYHLRLLSSYGTNLRTFPVWVMRKASFLEPACSSHESGYTHVLLALISQAASAAPEAEDELQFAILADKARLQLLIRTVTCSQQSMMRTVMMN